MTETLRPLPQTAMDAYAFIRNFKAENSGVAPTIREIGEAIGVPSTSHVRYLVGLLESHGYVSQPCENVARYILLTGEEYIPPPEPSW